MDMMIVDIRYGVAGGHEHGLFQLLPQALRVIGQAMVQIGKDRPGKGAANHDAVRT